MEGQNTVSFQQNLTLDYWPSISEGLLVRVGEDG